MAPAEAQARHGALPLRGRRLVITGAARGLGRAFAIVAAEEGARVVLTARTLAALGAVADAIEQRGGGRPQVYACDLGEPGSVQAACAGIRSACTSASAPFAAAKHAQAGFSERLGAELRGEGIRVSAVYPPDFDDADPLDAHWDEVRDAGSRRLTSREVVAAMLFAISAPRVCAYPAIVLANMSGT
jgi:short-subunit dehydrogenase